MEEVQKQRTRDNFLIEGGNMILQNFVVQRMVGHPELKFESVLKNQCSAQNLVSTDKWQIVDISEKNSNCQIPKNKCYLCEKCPYTLFFYQRESRE